MLLKLTNVTKKYGNQRALNGISFSVKEPGIVGFLGPNAAGKSTTMKIITGYLPFDDGKVEVLGLDVTKESEKVKKSIGYLPEHNPLYVDMYVREFLEFCARLYSVQKPMNKVKEMIAKVGLEKEQNKKIRMLSKGYRQRVGLAHALIHDPKILILDEPTTGLDPNQVVEIRNLIKEISAEKLVLFSTHIMQEVEILCKDVIIIHQGNIVAQGPIHLIKELPSGYSLELETEENITIDFSTLKEIRKIEKISGNKVRLHIHGNEDIRKKIFEFCLKHNLTVLQLQKNDFKMEDVFRELTKNKS
ncbi:MAG: ATP-binding cassette domain-containing protein [Bacteroidia bacterium]|nr:ATP-binding cassette domain-containing protein [Bacteroidia bacterium]